MREAQASVGRATLGEMRQAQKPVTPTGKAGRSGLLGSFKNSKGSFKLESAPQGPGQQKAVAVGGQQPRPQQQQQRGADMKPLKLNQKPDRDFANEGDAPGPARAA